MTRRFSIALRLLACLGLLIPAGFGCNTGGVTAAPPSGAASAAAPVPASAFDADRAYADLKKQVDFGPRVPNTDGHDKCRDWLIAELNKSLGNAKRQDFDYQLPDKTLHMSNLLAQVNPDAKKQVMLCAHWDTRPTADMEIDPKKQKQPIPGANDGASGVAVLLELARVFAAKKPDVGVQIVLWDGEDYGPQVNHMFLGAKHYAKDPAVPRPDYAILIDMIGDKDLGIPREQNSQNVAPEVNDKVWKAAAALGITQFQDKVGQPIEDDHIPLQEAGWKAIDLIDFDYGPWHTLDDTPDKCSPASLKAVGDVLARVVYDEK
jgi:glutaminyl-peptide cyclotransferase